MGLLDLFRPRWRHSDAATRLDAISRLTNEAVLAGIAREDIDDSVRETAVARIEDPEVLARISLTGAATPAHFAAVAKLTDQTAIARIASCGRSARRPASHSECPCERPMVR